MSPGQCSCPACGTTLRVRDRSFVGRQIECPDCQVQLIIKQDDERKLFAERPKAEPTRSLAPLIAPASRIPSKLSKQLGGLLHSPLVMAWALAIGVTAFLAIMMLRPSVSFRTPTPEQSQPIVTAEHANDQTPPGLEQANDKVPEPTQAPAVIENPPAQNPVVVKNTNPESPPSSPTTALTPEITNPTATPTVDSNPKPVIPVPVKVDVEGLLKQRVTGFVTKAPLSRQKIIEQLEEMVGVPIRYDREELGEKNLTQPVSISVEATTVGGVLKTLLDSAGWEFVIENNSIRLKPRQVAGTSP